MVRHHVAQFYNRVTEQNHQWDVGKVTFPGGGHGRNLAMRHWRRYRRMSEEGETR